MQPLIDLTLDSQWTYEGANVLVNGDFEGAAGPPPFGWSATTAVVTREAGTRPGGSGSYVMQVAYNGASAAGYAFENALLVNGATYHIPGWFRSVDGTSIPRWGDTGADALLAPGAASVAWQQFNVIGVADAHLGMMGYCTNLAAGRAVQFDDVEVHPFINITRNIGSLPGNIVMGNGLTPATIPALIGGGLRGMTFGGVRRCATPPIPNGTYSIVALVRRTSSAAAGFILDCRQGGGTGYFYWDMVTNVLAGPTGTTYVDGTPGTAAGNMPQGPIYAVAQTGITLSAPTAGIVGMKWDYTLPWNSDIYGFRLYFGTLTPTQVRDRGEEMKSRINLW